MEEVLSFSDVFKKSVVSLQNSISISILQVLIVLLITFIIGLFIMYIYKITFEGVVYSYNFAVSLILLSLVTAIIILTISSNIVLSLGMVGALSIVRFRAAIKDPKDIVYQFWAISVGISCGASLFPIAIISSLFIGAILVILSKFKFTITTYLLIIKYETEAKREVLEVINKLESMVKSKTCSGIYIEETLEVKNIKDNTSFVEILNEIEGVESAILVKYNGDYSE